MNTPGRLPSEWFDQVNDSELLQSLEVKNHNTFTALAQSLSGSQLDNVEFTVLSTAAQLWIAMDKSVEVVDVTNAMSMAGNNPKLEKPLLSLLSLINKAKNLQKLENTQSDTKTHVKNIFVPR